MQLFKVSGTNILQIFSAKIAQKPSRDQFKLKFKFLARLVLDFTLQAFCVIRCEKQLQTIIFSGKCWKIVFSYSQMRSSGDCSST